MASRPRCDRPWRPAPFFRSRDPRPAGSGGAEGEHPLDVPCMVTRLHSPRTCRARAAGNWRNPRTDLMMPNTGSGICYAENRASCLLAFSAEAPWPRPALGFSARAVGRRSARPEVDDAAVGPWRSAARSLPLRRPPLPCAEIAGIGQQRFRPRPVLSGKAPILAEHRFELLLVVRGFEQHRWQPPEDCPPPLQLARCSIARNTPPAYPASGGGWEIYATLRR